MHPNVSPIKESITIKCRSVFSLHLSFALLFKMYCPPAEIRIVSNAPMLIFAIVSKCLMFLCGLELLKSTGRIMRLVPKPNRFADWHNPTGILVRISSAILYNSEGNRKTCRSTPIPVSVTNCYSVVINPHKGESH